MAGWSYGSPNKRIHPADWSVDSIVIGSNTLDGTGKRFFFNKTKGALRSGETTGTQWDDANVGLRSVAFSLNTTASGQDSFATGSGSAASGLDSVALAGNCTASANAAVALAGGAASGSRSVAQGAGSVATADNAVALGNGVEARGTNSNARGYGGIASGYGSTVDGVGGEAKRLGQYVYSSVWDGAKGDGQANRFIARRVTTDATATVLLFDQGLLTTNAVTLTGEMVNVLTVPVNRAHRFVINAVARRSDVVGTFATWKIEGSLVRGAGGSNARFIAAPTVTADKDTGLTWDLAVSINTTDATNNYLAITATGAAGATIRWVAEISTVEVG